MAWWETYFDDLYLELYQQLAAPDRERDRQQAEAAVLMARIVPPARILDLCCGYGRHTIPLALMASGPNGHTTGGSTQPLNWTACCAGPA